MTVEEESKLRSSYTPQDLRTQLSLSQSRTHVSFWKPAPAPCYPCFPLLETPREGTMCSPGEP